MRHKGRIGISVAALAAALLVLAACSGGHSFSPTGNSLYIASDGTITSAFVEEVDQSYYNKEDMLSFCEDAVTEYNSSKGASAAAYQSDAEKNEVLPVAITDFDYGSEATLVLTYASADDYSAFNEADPAAVAMILYAPAANTTGMPDMDLVTVADGTKVAASSVIGDSKLRIVLIEGAADVEVDGTLIYVSENVTVTGDSTAETAETGYSYLVFK